MKELRESNIKYNRNEAEERKIIREMKDRNIKILAIAEASKKDKVSTSWIMSTYLYTVE